MKYFVLLWILIGFVSFLSINNIYAMPSIDSQLTYDYSDVILLGKVISVNSTFSPTHNLYEIQAEKFLKNPQDSDIVFASGQKTVNTRAGNQIFSVNDRVLFFLNNNTMGYDQYSGIFGISSSRLAEPQWDKCKIFEKDIPREHWFLGGGWIAPKIQQGVNSDIENFKKDELVTITYDVSNLSDLAQEFDLDGIILVSNGTSFEVMATMNQHIILEPCTVYKTIDLEFTPNMAGFYNFEIKDPRSGSYGLGFTVVDNGLVIESPRKQIKSGISIDKIQCRDNLQLILKTSNNSPTCVKPETKTKLLERGWGEHAPIPEPEIIEEIDFDSAKYSEEFDSGSPLIYLDTSNPVLDNDNCERYAYWLTKHQKEKLDRYEDYPRYPPWGNQIFPLVDYCIKNGDLIKTIVNDKIQWSFSGNSEPEFKDKKITIIKISKGEIVSEKVIKFNGWTNQPNQEIVLTVTAPNGNVISTGKLSSMNNGTFADSITTGGPLWEQQDGIYLVTVQQGNELMNSAYFELELKDGNIITGK